MATVQWIVESADVSAGSLARVIADGLDSMGVGAPGAEFTAEIVLFLRVDAEYAEYVEEAARRHGIELQRLEQAR